MDIDGYFVKLENIFRKCVEMAKFLLLSSYITYINSYVDINQKGKVTNRIKECNLRYRKLLVKLFRKSFADLIILKVLYSKTNYLRFSLAEFRKNSHTHTHVV